MDGAGLAAERKYDLEIAAAWHTAKFAALAEVGKLKSLSTYIGKRSGKTPPIAAHTFFQGLKARGFPVEIRRVDRSSGQPRPRTAPQ